jgi:dienelactone hydrolase
MVSLIVAAATLSYSLLPKASGPYAVGTSRLPIEQSCATRTHRQITLWYPAARTARGERAKYVPSDEIMSSIRKEKLLDLAPSVFDSWASEKVDATVNAPIASDKSKWPLIFICPGQGLPILNYTLLAKQLASDGFIIAAMDFGSGGFLVENDKLLHEDPPGDDEAAFGKIADDWAAQVSEIISHLGSYEVLKMADLGKIAVIGHSLGGSAALEAARVDPRVKAAVDLDGVPESYVAEHGIASSALFLRSHVDYSDADLQRLHRTRAEWDKKGQDILATLKKLLAGPGSDAWILSIVGTNHISYSDAPFAMPSAISKYGGKIIDPKRLQKVEIQLVEDYLAHCFQDQPFPRKGFPPEVRVQVRRQASYQ